MLYRPGFNYQRVKDEIANRNFDAVERQFQQVAHTFQGTPYLDIRDFGEGVGRGHDDTTPMQRAANAALALTNGGVVCFPPGVFYFTHLNLSDIGTSNRYVSPSIVLQGSGIKATRLVGTSNGNILIDCIGRNFVHIRDMELGTDGTAVYQAALLLARRTGGGTECHHNIIERVYIRGEFSIAGAVALAAEVTRWNDVMIENDDPTNNYCCFLTSPNNGVAGIVSAHGTPLASTNTDNLMTGVVFWAEHNNATPVIFDESAEYTLVGCAVVPGGAKTGGKLVTYIAGDAAGAFHGPVRWIGALWESGQCTVHHLKGTSTYAKFYDIFDIGGSYNVGGDSHAIAFSDGSSIVHGFTMRELAPGLATGSDRSLDINIDYAFNCHLDIYSPLFPTSIIINNGKAGSFFRARTLTLADGEYGLSADIQTRGEEDAYGTTLPTAGTWTRGRKFWKTNPVAGESPGWHCVESGSHSTATDNTGDTDGSTGVITGMTDTSDFNIGEYVTVSAGFATAGPFRIIAKTASSITVDANSTSAQSNVTVETPDPVWAAMANLGA
jgi:hypothetical protein